MVQRTVIKFQTFIVKFLHLHSLQHLQEKPPRQVKNAYIQMFLATVNGGAPFSSGMLSAVLNFTGTALRISVFLESFRK